MPKIYKIIIAITLIFSIAFAFIFVKKISPYITEGKNQTKEKSLCLVATEVSSNNMRQFIKTRLFGYDLLEKQVNNLKEEVKHLKEQLKARNK